MSDHKIHIGLDTGEIKKSLFEISSVLDRTFGKGKGFELFSKDTQNLLKVELSRQIIILDKLMEDLGGITSEYHKELKGINQTDEKALRLKSEIFRIEKQRTQFAKDSMQLQKVQESLLGGSGEGPVAAESMGGGGGGGIMQTALGFLTGSVMRTALNKVMIPYEKFAESVPQRLRLMGRLGVGADVSGGSDYLTNVLGYKPGEVRAAQEQSVGIFGAKESTIGSSLDARMRFARGTGTDISQVQGLSAGVQAQGGFNQANRVFEEFRATILSNKLEHALGPYFEAIEGVLGEINENGLGLTGEAMQGIARIAGNGQNVSAQQAARLVAGLDSYVKNASGPVQALMMQAYANVKNPIGGGVMGGAEAGLQYGLFGGGTEEQLQGAKSQGLLKSNDLAMIKALGFGGEGASKKRAGAYYNKLSSMMTNVGPNATEAEKEQAWLANSYILRQGTGARDDTEAQERFNALHMLSQGKMTQKAASELWEGDDPAKIMKSSEGYLQSIDAKMARNLEILGKDISAPIVKIKDIISNLLGGASSVAETAGNIWTGITTLGGAMPGGTSLDPLEGWRQLTNGGNIKQMFDFMSDESPLTPQQMGTASGPNRAQLVPELQDEIEVLKSQIDQAKINDPSAVLGYARKEAGIEKVLDFIKEQIELQKKQVDLHQQQVDMQKKKNTPKPSPDKHGKKETSRH